MRKLVNRSVPRFLGQLERTWGSGDHHKFVQKIVDQCVKSLISSISSINHQFKRSLIKLKCH